MCVCVCVKDRNERKVASLASSTVMHLPPLILPPMFTRRFFATSLQSVRLSHFIVGDLNASVDPCVVMHGSLGSSANFRSLAKGINHLTGVPFVLVDLRNHGSR